MLNVKEPISLRSKNSVSVLKQNSALSAVSLCGLFESLLANGKTKLLTCGPPQHIFWYEAPASTETTYVDKIIAKKKNVLP